MTQVLREINGYTHEPRALSQLAECLASPSSRLFERLDRPKDASDKICEETLVMLAREFQRRGKDTLAWKVVLAICERVQPSLLRAVTIWRLSPMAAEELVESVVAVLYQKILSTDDGFWEVRFWICYERRLLTELNRYRAMVDRNSRVADGHRILEDSLVETSRTDTVWKDPALRAVIAEGLAQLPDPLRTAFMLKHWAGFPEFSADPTDQATISKIMGVTDRTVRNYLTRAEQILNEWRRENHEGSQREGAKK